MASTTSDKKSATAAAAGNGEQNIGRTVAECLKNKAPSAAATTVSFNAFNPHNDFQHCPRRENNVATDLGARAPWGAKSPHAALRAIQRDRIRPAAGDPVVLNNRTVGAKIRHVPHLYE